MTSPIGNIEHLHFTGMITNIQHLNSKLIISVSSSINYGKNGVINSIEPQKYLDIIIDEVVNIYMDDWFEDESIPVTNCNGTTVRLNENSNVIEYNVIRKVSELPYDFHKHLNLNYEIQIGSIAEPKTKLLHTIINTSLSKENEIGETIAFHSGPLHLLSKQISLIVC